MRSRVGFTLVEILIAMMILSVAITAALQVSNATLRLGAQSQFALWASKGVQEYYLEYFRSLSFTDVDLNVVANRACIATVAAKPPVLDPATAFSKDRLPGSDCKYWVELEGGSPELKKITILVTWKDPDNRDRSSVISTLVTRDGITN